MEYLADLKSNSIRFYDFKQRKWGATVELEWESNGETGRHYCENRPTLVSRHAVVAGLTIPAQKVHY